MAYRLYDYTSKVDSEDCAAPSPGPLPATSNVSLYISPVRAVAPTAVLNSGKLDRVGPHVHANTLSHHLGIFRRNLAAPLRWLSCSFPLDSSPDSGSLDLDAPSGTSALGRFSSLLGFSVPCLRFPFESLCTLAQPLFLRWPTLEILRGLVMPRGSKGDHLLGWASCLAASQTHDRVGCLPNAERGPCCAPPNRHLLPNSRVPAVANPLGELSYKCNFTSAYGGNPNGVGTVGPGPRSLDHLGCSRSFPLGRILAAVTSALARASLVGGGFHSCLLALYLNLSALYTPSVLRGLLSGRCRMVSSFSVLLRVAF